jgi:hypothetical protein
MRVAVLVCTILGSLAMAGCQTQPYASGDARADALMAELQAESVAAGMASKALTIAAAMDPSGMAAGPAHAINQAALNANAARINAGLQSRQMAEEMAVLKCFEDSKAIPGKAGEEYAVACTKRARGQL